MTKRESNATTAAPYTRRARRPDTLTVHDQFCGAGGSSIGATDAGLEVALAMNHWKRAVETHATNFPDTDHDEADISAIDPRRYAPADILITSPECTNHSLAKGTSRRKRSQHDMFVPLIEDASAERSRATMWDVVRFAEVHRYKIVVTENVVDAAHWELFDTWLAAMHRLGYRHRVVSLNSMFAPPTPQSRDRIYVVFWRTGNRAPDLDFRPTAPCARCNAVVDARQAWKNGRTVGKYRKQYVYVCATCGADVEPFYFAALNAIDWTIAGTRIGDRSRPLQPRTRERIKHGLEKYGRTPLVITANMPSRLDSRVRPVSEAGFTQPASAIYGVAVQGPPAFGVTMRGGDPSHVRASAHGLDEPVDTQVASSSTTAIVGMPFSVHMGHGAVGHDGGVRDLAQPARTQTTAEEVGVVVPGAALVLNTRQATDDTARVKSATEPLRTQTASADFALAMHPGLLVTAGSRENAPASLGGAVPTLTGSERFGVVTHDALVSMFERWPRLADGATLVRDGVVMTMRDPAGGYLFNEPTAALLAQLGRQQAALISRSPFVVSFYGSGPLSQHGSGPLWTQPANDRHAIVEAGSLEPPALDVDDCYFRMLQPHEIGAAMAFPSTYVVLGDKRDKVKQYGNAVTPPVMKMILDRCIESLHPEYVRGTNVNATSNARKRRGAA